MEIFLITPEWLNVLPKFATKYCFELKKKTPSDQGKYRVLRKVQNLLFGKKIFHQIPVYPFHPLF